MTKMWQTKQYYRQCICMGKKIKNYSRNNVILSLWSRSVGIYDFRVDSQVDISCLRLQIILSTYGKMLGLPAREAFHFHCFFKTFDIHIHLCLGREEKE